MSRSLPHTDTAYSSLLPLNETHVSLVYERGPMGSRVGAGEYARTIHWQAVRLPAVMLAILVERGGGEGSGRLECWFLPTYLFRYVSMSTYDSFG